ncbi:uncharacterized protein LOC131597859 [Vicia villosa]|uniref:uncharacterized protein LOC131597859 n=1 Tax=Vicia villosa TaxID=3911 RepID=UPI00273ACAC4|nr:uncharacterized protein LOC131597859 [Vicia villosa]
MSDANHCHLPTFNDETSVYEGTQGCLNILYKLLLMAKLEPPPNVINEFNPNEIVRDPSRRKQINEYDSDIQDRVRKKPDRAEHFGFEVFTKSGYKDWKHASQCLKDHVGSHNSLHDSCVKHYDDYNNQIQSVANCSRYLIAQDTTFRGHDGSLISLNKGNFREMVDWVKSKNEQVRDTFYRDESHGISVKEQMTVMLRFVNDKGNVMERFIALHHVKDTTSESLKDALYGIFDKYISSISRIRGQGYDEASNMRGEFNGLQRNILDKNPYAFYVHCFAHRLQLVVLSVASKCSSIRDFLEYISLIVTTTSASCKRKDALTEA